ncbi:MULTISPECIES: hypothetical protein [Planktothricoides]|uniref:Uncharacterized protein n=2 Tax=Planktothricoides raciborskii TaxID=132608 RepID=A0AAU8J9E9_9CYAN|nr:MULTISPECIES: hypothetical protein [Planktothricoides]MBD2546541.1 hypothetical protein [Planktothricoides raciborskii FACHB-1370]
MNHQGNFNDSPKTHGRHGGLIYQLHVGQKQIQPEEFNFSYRIMTYNLLDQPSVIPQP